MKYLMIKIQIQLSTYNRWKFADFNGVFKNCKNPQIRQSSASKSSSFETIFQSIMQSKYVKNESKNAKGHTSYSIENIVKTSNIAVKKYSAISTTLTIRKSIQHLLGLLQHPCFHFKITDPLFSHNTHTTLKDTSTPNNLYFQQICKLR